MNNPSKEKEAGKENLPPTPPIREKGEEIENKSSSSSSARTKKPKYAPPPTRFSSILTSITMRPCSPKPTPALNRISRRFSRLFVSRYRHAPYAVEPVYEKN